MSPDVETISRSDAPREASASLPDMPCRVLVIDDDRVHCAMLRHICEGLGASVATAHDGDSGIATYEELRPDIVLMDLHMPGMGGLETTRRIRRLAGDDLLTIIFITGSDDDRTLVRCLEAGGDDFLTKPLNRAVLQARLHASARTRALWAEIRRNNAELREHHALAERDKEIASEILGRLVARSDRGLPGLSTAVLPMDRLSGDVVTTKRAPDGQTHVLVADFTGHGLSAAVGGIPVFDLFYAMTEKGHALGPIAEELNDKLGRVLPAGLFCACVLLRVDPERREVEICNAGMPDVLVLSASGRVAARFPSASVPLGILPKRAFRAEIARHEVNAGESLFAFSDGLTEAADPTGALLGMARLEAILERARSDSGRLRTVLEEIDHWRDGAAQRDDVTLVELDLEAMLDTPARAGESGASRRRPSGPPETRGRDALDPRLSGAATSDEGYALHFRFAADVLRASDPVPQVGNALLDIAGFAAHRGEVLTVLTELFVNALDHGLLRMDSSLKVSPDGFERYFNERERRLLALDGGAISMDLRFTPRTGGGGRLELTVQDTGPGFDHAALCGTMTDPSALCGRGLLLARSIAKELSFNARGNAARAVLEWD